MYECSKCNHRFEKPYTIIGSMTNYNECPNCNVSFSHSRKLKYSELELEDKTIEERIYDIELLLKIRKE